MMIQNLVTLKMEINHHNISDSCQKFILFLNKKAGQLFGDRISSRTLKKIESLYAYCTILDR